MSVCTFRTCLFFYSSIDRSRVFSYFFFFNDPATPEISPLPLHDALPIYRIPGAAEVVGLPDTAVDRAHVENIGLAGHAAGDRKSTRLNSSHSQISYAVFCLKKKRKASFRLRQDNSDL